MSLLSRLAVQAARAYGVLSSKGGVSASYLVVAGGGAGGDASGGGPGGGGGAGGFRTGTSTLSTLNTYTVVVGSGGAGVGTGTVGGSGGTSSISGTGITTITSAGGGGGGYASSSATVGIGVSGGSGGGAGWNFSSGGTGNTPSTSPSQGSDGGATLAPASTNLQSAGGGGATAVGGNGTSLVSGAGGAGTASSISGSSVTYAGGGGGSSFSLSGGAGGAGGGGAGGTQATVAATAGTVNTGGGGGGGANYSGYTGAAGKAGGSGVVIISYTSATPKFVGGTLTTSGGNQIHTFTSSGTLSPLTPVTASYLVVAGGGGGGGYYGGGGGGAGGLLTSSTTIYSGATYVVTVGAGGAGGVNTFPGNSKGTNGSLSSLAGTGLTTLSAAGGGGGGSNGLTGLDGGSGGGSGGGSSSGTPTGGAGTSGQGYAGGNGTLSSLYGAGGGGGSSAVGSAGTTVGGGNGGAGTASSISGTSVTYAGGGGGGSYGTAGSGGAGGGGAAGLPPTGGTTNLGGGGGGTHSSAASGAGAAGGSGTVIISYAGSQVFNGGLVTSSGGNTIHTFNATGALTPLTNNLNNSLRFRSSASAYLNRTPSVAGNLKTWTWSAWVKLGAISANEQLFSAGTNANGVFIDGTAGGFGIDGYYNGTRVQRYTTALYRDPSAWYHVVAVVDTTQATNTNRLKMYINGNQIDLSIAGTGTYPAQNSDGVINSAVVHAIGRRQNIPDLYFDGYMTDINFIDGQALEPYYFGNNDANGVWKPILYKGTYGTNGFYLTFADTSALTTSSNAGLGKDTSGNGNYWATNNISITAGTTYDPMTDVPTNTSATVANFPVLSPLNYRTYSGSATPTISNANLTVTQSSTVASCIGTATMGATASGKYYWEATFVSGSGSNNSFLGVVAGQLQNTSAADLGYYSNEYSYKSGNGYKYSNNTQTAYGSSYTSGDVIGFALDLDAGTLTFYKNNTSQGVAYSGLSASETYFPAFDTYYNNTFAYNFGQRPFAYTPPSGHIAINTYNLPTPTILQGNLYMDATLYTGTEANGTVIVNQGQFKPDLVWIKTRSTTAQHVLTDSVRGVTKQLFSSLTNAEQTSATGITSLNSNGFTLGTNVSPTGSTNGGGNTLVGWQWQAGQGSSSSNTSGSITSTVSVNTTAGFSVVTYTGTGANATVGHGLGVSPKVVLIKERGNANGWYMYHVSTGNTVYLDFTSAAGVTGTGYWQSTTPSSTVVSISSTNSLNRSGGTYVMYAWAEIAGFSKFTSYVGNGSTDGPFVYLGFRPKYVMVKGNVAGVDWAISDSSRNTSNVVNARLFASTSAAEDTSDSWCDFLSNGFKIRSTNTNQNYNGQTFIVMAWAENPFKNSNAR